MRHLAVVESRNSVAYVVRAVAFTSAVCATVILQALDPIPGKLLAHSTATLSEDSVEFQGGAGDRTQWLRPGDMASFYVKDSHLATSNTCTGIWANINTLVEAGAEWGLATGEPHPDAFALSSGCSYDTASPGSTPLALPPAQQLPWEALVDGVGNIIAAFDASTGQATLLNHADAGDEVEIDFYFDVVDTYSAVDQRVRVHSTSDASGEWVSFVEVVGEADPTASPTSDLFLGQVLLSDAVAAAETGDGKVWARPGDFLTVTFSGAGGTPTIASHSIDVVETAPAPVPVGGVATLILAAGLFAIVLSWRLKYRRLASGR
jgi:hypothetical protein